MTSEICIPLDSLAEGDGESAVPPAVGDPVEFSATGTVTRVDGGNAYITPESVNGQPIPTAASEPDMDAAALQGAAATADEEFNPIY